LKTTKMISAALAVFLAAALFIGAASAVPAAGETVYVYQYNGSGDGAAHTYYLYENGYIASTVQTDDHGTFIGDDIKAGLYSNNVSMAGNFFTLKYPAVTLKATLNGTSTSIAGYSLFKDQTIDFSVSGTNNLLYKLIFYSAAGGSTSTFGGNVFNNSSVFVSVGDNLNVSLANEASGEWSVAAALLTGNVNGKMESGTASKYTTTSKITFNVGTDYADSITVSKDSIIRGASILLTVNGMPNEVVVVNVTGSGFNNFLGQSNVNALSYDPDGYLTGFTIKLNNFGTRTAQFDTNATSDDQTYTFTAHLSPDKKANVTVTKGEVTAVAGQDSYYPGNDITLSGTNTESTIVYLYLKGSNKALTFIDSTAVRSDNTWEKTFELSNEFDAGTYTFYATAQQLPGISGMNLTIDDDVTTYTHLYVALKQPFLSATAESSTVIPSNNIKITGTAKGTSDLMYYVFGTNLFKTGSISVDDDSTFSAEIATDDLAAGQYFVVIQHPMYDKVFNIGPVASENSGYNIKMNAQGDYASDGAMVLFDTNSRQSANAAEALCQALDSQNIDDIYVKLTFVVESPYLTVNSFSSSYTKGELIEITGTANPVTDLYYYVFGQDTFLTGTIQVTPDGQYLLKIDTKNIEGNDFYVVIQHPMSDGLFNVGPVISANGGYDIKMNTTGGFDSPDSVILFNTLSRQGENAAEAICQAIDSYQIDDICTKLYFLASSTPTNIVLSPGFTLTSLTVIPEYSPAVTEGTPIFVTARLNIAKDAISTSESLKFSTDLRQSTSWYIYVYKGNVLNNKTSEDALITSFNSTSFAHILSGFVLDYDQPVTLVINLTGLYPLTTGNITALKIDGPDFTYSYLYGPTHRVPSFSDELELHAGWNFISVPKTLNATENTAGLLFASVETNNTNILGYNTQTGTWVPLKAGDIIQPLNGYWIYSANKTNISLTYPSTPTTPSVKTLYLGWNAIGLSSAEPASARSALAGTSWRTLIPWNLTDGSYESAIVNGGSDVNSPDRLMTLGNGYWLYVDSQSTLTGLTA